MNKLTFLNKLADILDILEDETIENCDIDFKNGNVSITLDDTADEEQLQDEFIDCESVKNVVVRNERESCSIFIIFREV